MKKLVAYVTTAYPSKEFTVDLSLQLAQSGVDILELGIAFSDPVADGAVIEKANLLSLKNGFTMNDVFEVSKQITPHIRTLWMGYMNSFYHQGMENIVKKAQSLGVKGAIIPDLPFEEACLYDKMFTAHEQALIRFVAPTHDAQRIKAIVSNAQEFIYLVAYAGITGSGQQEDLSAIIQEVKKHSQTPLYIGFGVDEKSCKEKVKGVDGVIVGSAFVKHLLDDSLNYTQKINQLSNLALEIKEKINE